MNAGFVARMEEVLAVYERPYDLRFPVVCFDERPCVLHGQPTEPLPPVPAQPAVGNQPAKAGQMAIHHGKSPRQTRPPLSEN